MKNFKAFILSMVLIPQLAMAMPTKVDGLRSVGNVNVTGNVTATGSITGASAAISGSASVAGSLSVGTSSAADSKSVIDMVSTTKGMLPPRMTTTQRDAIAYPPAGLTVYNTTTNALNAFNGTVWKAVGSGSGDGGINYITNGKAEDDTLGWAAYADAAGTDPVDGTGGSPNSTFTRTTSSPLANTASFLWTKAGSASRQGEGFSYDFSIDPAYQGQPLSINYLFGIASGTFATGDMSVWIYDVTNSKVTQPSAHLIGATTIPGPVQELRFQAASNSTSYRLIFHTATTSTQNYTLKFDNISVGPQISVTGVPVTATNAFTPTGSWTTNSTYTGKWWQVGDRLHFRVRVNLAGAPNATSLTINYLPSGLATDASKMLGTATNGSVPFAKCGVRSAAGSYEAEAYFNGTNLAPVAINSAGTYAIVSNVTATVPGTFASGDSVECASIDGVPIVGWGSNTIVSSSAATRVVAATAYSNVNLNAGPNNTHVKIALNTALSDTHGMVNGASGRIEVKVPGRYRISAIVNTSGANTLANLYLVSIYKNGIFFRYGNGVYNPGVSASIWLTGGVEDDANVGDYYELYIYGQGNNSSSLISVNGGVSGASLSLSMIQGPSQIQAATSVVFKGTLAATGLTTSTWTVLPATKVKDSTGSWNGSEFVVPAPGDYEISAYVPLIYNNYAVGNRNIIAGYKNGIQQGLFAELTAQTTSNINIGMSGSFLFEDCVVGDKLVLRGFSERAGSNVLDSGGRIQIKRLGGVN